MEVSVGKLNEVNIDSGNGFCWAAIPAQEPAKKADPSECLWHDAEKDPPKESGRYFVYDQFEHVYTIEYEPENEPDERWGYWESCWDMESLAETDRYFSVVLRDKDAIYWMEIPEPPKKGGQE